MSGLEDLDFFTDKSLVDDPYDYYDAIRSCPVRREPAHAVVMVSGYDEAVAVQRDADESFSVCNIVSGPWSGIPVETDSDDISDLIEQHRHTVPLRDYFVSFDPPKHTAHRSLLNRLFTPKQLKNNEDFLWRLADEQLDHFVAEGKCEIVIDYSFPFTMVADADLLGVPEADHERFGRAPTSSRLKGVATPILDVLDEPLVFRADEVALFRAVSCSSLATSSAARTSTSRTATRCPARARSTQIACPRPDPPPVTTETRPTLAHPFNRDAIGRTTAHQALRHGYVCTNV